MYLLDSPISVLFVDNTKGGLLAKRFKEEEKRLGRMTGYNVRVAETAGMALSRLLPSTNPWGAGDCGRQDCPVCEQGDEVPQNCKKRNILYESSCQICQVDGKISEKKRMENSKGVYVGESSRSLYERSKEHQKDGKEHAEDSHQWKHWTSEHQDIGGDPQFKFRIVSTFRDPLTRQLAESVRIERRGVDILNSKSEYSRCRVPRLQVDMEGWTAARKKESEEEARKTNTTEEEAKDKAQMDEFLLVERSTRRLESKRKETGQERRKKKMKFDRLVGWGEEAKDQVVSNQQEDGIKLPIHQTESRLQEHMNTSSIHQGDMISWKIGSTKNDDEIIFEERITAENKKMLEEIMNAAQNDPKNKLNAQKRKKDISEKVRRKKFVFNTRGKITNKESKELIRTHGNIFDWLQKQNRDIFEKDMFERKEDAEDDINVETDSLEKEMRLEKVSRERKVWSETSIEKDKFKVTNEEDKLKDALRAVEKDKFKVARNNISNLIEKWEDPGGLQGTKVEEGEMGSTSSRRASQEFKTLQQVFEQSSQQVGPVEINSTKFNLSKNSVANGTVGSMGKIFEGGQAAGHLWNNFDFENENEMDSYLKSSRIDGQPLLANTRTNGKRGKTMVSGTKKVQRPWR